jgi:hypothetical protein
MNISIDPRAIFEDTPQFRHSLEFSQGNLEEINDVVSSIIEKSLDGFRLAGGSLFS